MKESRLLRIAIWREIYSRRKAFAVTTVVALALVVGGLGFLAFILDDDGPTTVTVGLIGGGSGDLRLAMEDRIEAGVSLELVSYDDRSIGEQALRSGSISALVIGPHDVLWAQETPAWVSEMVASAMGQVNITRAATEFGLEQDQVQQLLTPIEGETIDYEGEDVAAMVLAITAVILMFIAIIAYGQWIAYGVVEEKANRIAELILGALSPGQLLTAKLISLGGLGLLQLSVVAGGGVVTAALLTNIPLPEAASSTLAWFILWFLLGYAFYGSLYASAGSLAADTQEAGAFIGPLNFLPGIGYMIGVIAFSSASTTLIRVISLIPPWTPLLMPGRIANGTVELWELLLAMGLMVFATLAMMRFAAGVYMGGITQATRKVGWLQAFRSGRDIATQ